jgi:hypothetical protein
MGLFRRSGPVVFDPYGSRRRSGWPIPRWLMILSLGIALGAGGLFYVQENHLPARLTPAESKRLQARFDEVDAERQTLRGELDQATRDAKALQQQTEQQAKAARAEIARLSAELADARQSVQRLEQDLVLFEEVLPPDPRDGSIEVRAARFANEGGELAYHVLLTREQKGGKPFEGVMQLAVAGQRAGGRSETVTLDPVEVSFADYQHLKGSLPLPEGFTARQTTIRVLAGEGGRTLGMRVIRVR